MRPRTFSQANRVYAKNQPEYAPLPAHVNVAEQGIVTTCWKMNWKEKMLVLLFGRVWAQTLTFNKPLQPQRLSIRCPLVEKA
jgi:hypothetical protein